ncbi:MAG: hypothetical protein ACT4TC_21360 [Myxococcaceae bacterium]
MRLFLLGNRTREERGPRSTRSPVALKLIITGTTGMVGEGYTRITDDTPLH